MLWKLVELTFVGLFILAMITEVFIPLFTDGRFFGSFRKSEPTPKNTVPTSDLESELEGAKNKVKEVKEVQTKVKTHYDKASSLKKESEEIFHKE